MRRGGQSCYYRSAFTQMSEEVKRDDAGRSWASEREGREVGKKNQSAAKRQ